MTAERKTRISITRAKLVDSHQFRRVLEHVKDGAHPERDTALLMLSFYCGLRAQEIAGLQWKRHILTAGGEVGTILRITSDIAKGANHRVVEREIPLAKEVRDALIRLYKVRGGKDRFVIYPLHGPRLFVQEGYENRTLDGGCDPNTLAQYFRRLYQKVGLVGATSHSGRRTFITNLARKTGTVGASIKDVQLLAGHRNLETTAQYIEPSKQVRKLIGKVF